MLLAFEGLDVDAARHDVATAELGGTGADRISVRASWCLSASNLIWTIR